MEKRKRPSKQAMDNFARTLAPYVAEIIRKRKAKEAELGKFKNESQKR
jgi:hypothetical protein